jgi:hypothetical protein
MISREVRISPHLPSKSGHVSTVINHAFRDIRWVHGTCILYLTTKLTNPIAKRFEYGDLTYWMHINQPPQTVSWVLVTIKAIL